MKRIFIVGCQRSGTTLLQSMLAPHSQVASFTESHFFNKGFLPLFGKHYLLKSGIETLVHKFLSKNNGITLDKQWLWPKKRSGTTVALKTAMQLIELLDQCAIYRNSETWVEKTPNHLFFIPLITQVAPDARFIHIIRQPEAVLPSQYKASRQWGRPKSYLECAIHWCFALWVSEKYVANSAHYFLSYENLTNDPLSQLKPLFEWLGLPWESRVLDNYKEASHDIVASDEIWKTRNFNTITNRNKNSISELPWYARFIIKMTRSEARLIRIISRTRE